MRSADGCSDLCLIEFCGDGIIQLGTSEECDLVSVVLNACGGAAGAVGMGRCSDKCKDVGAMCPADAVCGNGAIDVGESCDDGAKADGDGCGADCQSETCGNGILNAWEACDGDRSTQTCQDLGFSDGAMRCDDCALDFSGCFNAVCGNGVLELPEECDDKNRRDGDGCDPQCKVADCACEPADRLRCALTEDGTSVCVDIDECSLDNGGCGPAAAFLCVNRRGLSPICKDVDECEQHGVDCGENKECINTVGAFECRCPAGFSAAGATCLDIDECALGTDSCDDVFARCVNQIGAPAVCADVNECDEGTDPCNDVFQVCVNRTNAAPLCEDLDECVAGTDTCNHLLERCVNQENAAPTCVDRDECIEGSDSCHDLYQTCENRHRAAPRCIDIDECARGTDPCHRTFEICMNQDGVAPKCLDIDECKLGTDNCDDVYDGCVNLAGKGCRCDDIDECAVNNGECGSASLIDCINHPRSSPSCEDIDECAVNNGGCGSAVDVQCLNRHAEAQLCVPKAIAMDIGPGNITLLPGLSMTFSVVAIYAGSVTDNVTALAAFASSNQAVFIVDGSVVRAVGPGTATLTVRHQSLTAQFEIIVASLVSNALQLASPSANAVITVPTGANFVSSDVQVVSLVSPEVLITSPTQPNLASSDVQLVARPAAEVIITTPVTTTTINFASSDVQLVSTPHVVVDKQ